jgi:hypothetical protein
MNTIPDYLLCSRFDVIAGTCLQSELGKFHIKARIFDITNELLVWGNKTETANNPSNADSHSIGMEKRTRFKYVVYKVKETGYYCVFLASDELEGDKDYKVELIVNNT